MLVVPGTRRNGKIPTLAAFKGVEDDLESYFPECGQRQYTANELENFLDDFDEGTSIYDVTFGVRNPAANNYGVHYYLGNEEEPATPINFSEPQNAGRGYNYLVVTPENVPGQIGVDLEGYLNGFAPLGPKTLTLPAGVREPVYQIADRVTFDFDNNPTRS